MSVFVFEFLVQILDLSLCPIHWNSWYLTGSRAGFIWPESPKPNVIVVHVVVVVVVVVVVLDVVVVVVVVLVVVSLLEEMVVIVVAVVAVIVVIVVIIVIIKISSNKQTNRQDTWKSPRTDLTVAGAKPGRTFRP